jgi:hypothetical protein
LHVSDCRLGLYWSLDLLDFYSLQLQVTLTYQGSWSVCFMTVFIVSSQMFQHLL